MGFATGGKTFFLWGGCMMVINLFSFIPKFTSENFHLCSSYLRSLFIYLFQMHADDFRNDHHGVVSELRDGGYSDDMTLAAIAGKFSNCVLPLSAMS